MIRAAALLALAPCLGGCVALAIPAVAASSVVKSRMDGKRAQRRPAPIATPTPAPAQPGGAGNWRATGLTELPPPSGRPAVATPAARPAGAVGEGAQYLYGSGEGAALSVQAYQAFINYVAVRAEERRKGAPLRQVVLSDGAALNAPHFETCRREQPLAAVFDIDETAILNLGYEADATSRGLDYDAERWLRWEKDGADKVVAVPGAVNAVKVARAMGVTVIFNSNRSAANADATAAALDHAGLGPVSHGTTLWLQGDDGGGNGKDDRRWAITSGYCVVALVGDQLGDFSDLFNTGPLTASTRRALVGSRELAGMWGNGWFMLPNPVYGTGVRGGLDDVFPVDMRWTDPGEGVK